MTVTPPPNRDSTADNAGMRAVPRTTTTAVRPWEDGTDSLDMALKRVDVVLRRVDAEYADPLDLRPDSRLGVVGLVEALRRGAGELMWASVSPWSPDRTAVLMLGVFVVLSPLRGWWVDGARTDRREFVGALLCVVGVITAGDRFADINNVLTILRLAAVVGVVSVGFDASDIQNGAEFSGFVIQGALAF